MIPSFPVRLVPLPHGDQMGRLMRGEVGVAFAQCSSTRTFSVVWACRDQWKAVQTCVAAEWASPSSLSFAAPLAADGVVCSQDVRGEAGPVKDVFHQAPGRVQGPVYEVGELPGRHQEVGRVTCCSTSSGAGKR